MQEKESLPFLERDRVREIIVMTIKMVSIKRERSEDLKELKF